MNVFGKPIWGTFQDFFFFSLYLELIRYDLLVTIIIIGDAYPLFFLVKSSMCMRVALSWLIRIGKV